MDYMLDEHACWRLFSLHKQLLISRYSRNFSMISISATPRNTFQTAIVNSIRLNTDTQAAICLYTHNNSNRSTMIAMNTSNFHIDSSFIPTFEHENIQCYNLKRNMDQKKSSFRSVLY